MTDPQPAHPSLRAAVASNSVTLLLLDQHERWQRGERVLVEAYLEREPQLGSDTEKILDLVYHEIVLREERGETPRLEEYVDRFPRLTDQLRLHFEVHQAMRSGAPSVAGATSVPPGRGDIPRPTVPGYTLLGLLGRGGMGVVYQARQEKLHRLVALKMLLSGDHAGPGDLARFRREAEAVARLQHPNIVQVFDVGEHQGRPYLALELVAGGSLAQCLAGTPQMPRAAAELVQTLARAMQHAHEQGIVHRDLKPANVLLAMGGIGPPAEEDTKLQAAPTPKITDFGLAKWLDAETSQSHSGAVVGTPSYMAPEQAANRPGQVGPAADVYALGAILYECLTGRPPFRGATLLETLEQVRSQDPVPARLLQPKVSRDLDTICLKCLEKEARKRYASARELAEDLRRFLAGEPIKARPVGAWGQAVKWARRRPAAAALIAVSMVGGAALLATLLLSNISIAREKAQADSQRERAETNLELARQAVDDYITKVSQDPRLRQHDLEGLRKQLLRSALGFYHKFAEQAGDDPNVQAERGRAYHRLGSITEQVGNHAEAISLYEQAAGIFDQLAHDHPDVADYRRELAAALSDVGNLHLRAGQHERAEAEFHQGLDLRRGLAEGSSGDADRQADLAASHVNLGAVYRKTGRPGDAETAFSAAASLLETLVRDYPKHARYQAELASCLNHLGLLHQVQGRLGPAETALERTRDLRRQLAVVQPADPERQAALAQVLENLAILYRTTGRPAAARMPMEQARDVRADVARAHPTVAECQFSLARAEANLGSLYQLLSKLPDAETCMRKGTDILVPLVRDHPDQTAYRSELAATQNLLGILCASTGRLGPAETALKEALAQRERLAREHPSVPDHQRGLAGAHHDLGNIYRRAGRGDDAEAAYNKALEIGKKLARAQPGIPEYQYDLACIYYSLAVLHQALNRPPKQIETALHEAIDILDGLAAAHSTVSNNQKLQARAHDNLGTVYRHTGRPQKAEQEYRKALGIREDLVHQQPGVNELAIDLGASYGNLGLLAQEAGKIEAARDWHRKSLEVLEPAYTREPKNPIARQYLATTRLVWAQVLSLSGEHRDALAACDRALELATVVSAERVRVLRLHELAAVGDHEAAARGADTLAKNSALPPGARYELAGVYALAAAAARKDKNLADEERNRMAQGYSGLALALLTAAEEAGFFKPRPNAEHLKQNRDFDALRQSLDFQELLRRVEGGKGAP
jgi:tetratricopeptide (TPR) repeat protein/tRNA A-37 threonylcarbamoyl transferase component Bud32